MKQTNKHAAKRLSVSFGTRWKTSFIATLLCDALFYPSPTRAFVFFGLLPKLKIDLHPFHPPSHTSIIVFFFFWDLPVCMCMSDIGSGVQLGPRADCAPAVQLRCALWFENAITLFSLCCRNNPIYRDVKQAWRRRHKSSRAERFHQTLWHVCNGWNIILVDVRDKLPPFTSGF